MFSEQREQLRQALAAAGLPPDAATRIANILGNSAQSMRHAGDVTFDNTPADLRMVGPQQRKLRFPHLDFREGDPDHRPKRTAPSENKKEKEPEPNVVQVYAPQQYDANFRVANGVLTEVTGDGQSAAVNVRNVVAARPPGGLPLAMLDSQANQFVGKAPRAQVAANDGTARLDIQETGQEMLWNLQMLNRADYDVVTKIEFIPGKGLEITYDRIKAWNQNNERVETIPTVDQPVVSEIVDDKHGLRGRRRTVTVLASAGQANTFFNVYRVGKFTGGWAAGATKTITQVWPTSPSTASVINLTQDVADTPSEKYVLYAIRTRDAVPTADTANDDPITTQTNAPQFSVSGSIVEVAGDPVAEYYAIEIQPASECTAFSSLNGKLVSALTGFNSTVPSALSYITDSEGEDNCLVWRSQLLTVVTDVALTEFGLEVSKANVYVLAAEAADPSLIPITDCPTEPA
jgi:hypothetical protein